MEYNNTNPTMTVTVNTLWMSYIQFAYEFIKQHKITYKRLIMILKKHDDSLTVTTYSISLLKNNLQIPLCLSKKNCISTKLFFSLKHFIDSYNSNPEYK